MATLENDFVEPHVEPEVPSDQPEASWSLPEINPWMLLLLAAGAYYVYQNYLSNIQIPSMRGENNSQVVTPQDEEKVRKMMEARSKQQEIYDAAARALEEKRKNEPEPKIGPISKQIAAKAKLRPEYNPLMGDPRGGSCSLPRRSGGRQGG